MSDINKDDFKGIWIPIEVWECQKLSLVEKILLVKIHSLDGPNGCYASNNYLSEYLQVSEWTIATGISKLKKFGLVFQESFNGRRRVLRTSSDHEISKGCLGKIQRLYNNRLISSKEDYAHSVGTGDIKASKRTIKPSRISDYVEYWNSLPNIRKHKDPSAKVYDEARKKIRQLMKGELGGMKFDQDWVEKNDIRNIRRPWSESLIYKGMDRLALLFKEGYWPEDKKWLPRSLPDLIYNAMTQKSWFLWVMRNGTPELHETREHKSGIEGKIAGKLKYALLRCRTQGLKLRPGEFPALKDQAAQMVKFYRANEKEDFRYHFPHIYEFIKDYTRRFIDKYEGTSTPDNKIKVSWIGIGSVFWDIYVRQLEDEMGVELRGKGK